MAYLPPDQFKERAREELDFFKRSDPTPILPALGWIPVEGKAKSRFSKDSRQIDMWGGKRPGDHYAFNVVGARPGSRHVTIVDLAKEHCGPAADDFAQGVKLLRRLFSNTEVLDWTEGCVPAESGENAVFFGHAGCDIDADAAARLRVGPDFVRVPHQALTDGGLGIVGWTDLRVDEDGETRADVTGKLGVWSTASAGARSILLFSELSEALCESSQTMRIWVPRTAEGIAAQLVKLAAERVGVDHVTVVSPDTAQGDLRRGAIRMAIEAAGVKTFGRTSE